MKCHFYKATPYCLAFGRSSSYRHGLGLETEAGARKSRWCQRDMGILKGDHGWIGEAAKFKTQKGTIFKPFSSLFQCFTSYFHVKLLVVPDSFHVFSITFTSFATAGGSSCAAPMQDHYSYESGKEVTDMEFPPGKRVFGRLH